MTCQHCQTANPVGTLMCNQCFMPLDPPVQNVPVQLVGARPSQPSVRLLLLENLQPTGPCLSLPNLNYEGEILVGRNDLSNQVIVDIDLTPLGGRERKVSRKHARIHFKQGRVFLEDWESIYGTYLNKQRLAPQQQHPLKAGDEIRLAEMIFRMEVA